MKTLIIYDNTGFVISVRNTTAEPRIPVGIPYIITEIPVGKQLKLVDGVCIDTSVVPHKLLLEDVPLTQLDSLESRLASTQQALDFLILTNMNGGNA